jgi:putative methyltransferase
MVRTAGAEKSVKIYQSTDFLKVEPDDAAFRNVRAILLDPSCSGSGIIGRDDDAEMSLADDLRSRHQQQQRLGMKRKRCLSPAEAEEKSHQDSKALFTRLENLAAFQLKLLLRAMCFPKAVMISYSTCSIHSEENESVIIQALSSKIAKERGWKILKRDDQFEGLKRWEIRGNLDACRSIIEELTIDDSKVEFKAEDIADACIRCEKGTKDGTMGFFVAGFVRSYENEELQEQSRRRREEARKQDIEYFKLRSANEGYFRSPAG